MHTPLVSVILAVHNGEKYLEECLQSIVSQTYKNWELVIVNDGSTDNTHAIIESFLKNSVQPCQYIVIEKRGISYSLNLAIRKSKGDYIANIDADDVMLNNRISEQVNFLKKNKNIGILGGWATGIDEIGKEIFTLRRPISDIEIKPKIHLNNIIIHPTTMIRRDFLIKNQLYNADYTCSQDYELLLRLSQLTTVENLPIPLIKYRYHLNQITQAKSKRMHLEDLRLKKNYYVHNGLLLTHWIYLIKPLFYLFIPNVLASFWWQIRIYISKKRGYSIH